MKESEKLDRKIATVKRRLERMEAESARLEAKIKSLKLLQKRTEAIEQGTRTGIVFQHDKRSGLTYAYESISFWDKEKQQSRAKRRLIGRVDTQMYLEGKLKNLSLKELQKLLIPTDNRGKNRKTKKFF